MTNDLNPWPVGTRLHDMMSDALAALDGIPYDGPVVEEHECQLRIVPGDTADVYLCTLTWSDGAPCNRGAMSPWGIPRGMRNCYLPARIEP